MAADVSRACARGGTHQRQLLQAKQVAGHPDAFGLSRAQEMPLPVANCSDPLKLASVRVQGIPCVFFGMQGCIFSPLQNYGHGWYAATGGAAGPGDNRIGSPYVYSSDLGRTWRQSCAPGTPGADAPITQQTGQCKDPYPGAVRTLTGRPLIPMVGVAFAPRDAPAGVLRSVTGDDICPCSGESCTLAAALRRDNSTRKPYGGCLPGGVGGTPEPPWHNFSTGRVAEFSAGVNGTPAYKIVERLSLFHGFQRPVGPWCTAPRHDPYSGLFPDNDDGTLHPSTNPLRLSDGVTLLMNVELCLGDRKLNYRPPTNLSAPTQVVFASTSEGRDWRWRGVVANPADYPDSVKGTTSELAIAELADRHRLVAIMRLDGDCACDEGNCKALAAPFASCQTSEAAAQTTNAAFTRTTTAPFQPTAATPGVWGSRSAA